MSVKVATITINYNGATDTLELIDSLSSSPLPPKWENSIYVLDNASTDDSVNKLINDKRITLIKSKTNTGFAAGNNIAIKRAIEYGSNIIILINNDCLVGSDFFEQIARSKILNPDVGVLGGLIYFAKGYEFKKKYRKHDLGRVIWYAGGTFDAANVLGAHRYVDQVDNGKLVEAETDFISGALFISKTTVFQKIGLFDEKFFMYLEDVDLCTRIRSSGMKLIFDPSIKIWHKVAQSSGIGSPLNDYFITRNRLLFGSKHASIRTKVALLREALKKLITGNQAQKTAIKDFFLGNLGKGSFIAK